MKSIPLTLKLVLLPLMLVALPLLSSAQGVIQKSSAPYIAQPDIQFAIVSRAAIEPTALTARTTAATPVAPVVVTPVKAAPQAVYEVISTDRTIREVLQRWARASGWKHEPVHWTLMIDFPVHGTASAEFFGSEFRDATRKLLSSTETTDLPVQPCFYTNFIVRVVPLAERCDRTASAAQ